MRPEHSVTTRARPANAGLSSCNYLKGGMQLVSYRAQRAYRVQPQASFRKEGLACVSSSAAVLLLSLARLLICGVCTDEEKEGGGRCAI